MEAWRRQLDAPVSAFPIVKAGPAHIATLKTFDPPLSALEGRRLAGARRRAKRMLFPTDDGELVLLVHLMTAGRLRYLQFGEKGPKTPAFQLVFEGGSRLVLTEAGAKKRAGVWLLTPEAAAAELEHLGPEALGLGEERLGEILREQSHRLHPLLRDQRVIAGIGHGRTRSCTGRSSLRTRSRATSRARRSSDSRLRSTQSSSAASSSASAA